MNQFTTLGKAPAMGQGRAGESYQYDRLFDQGSADSITIDGDTVRITPEKLWNSNWGWFAVRALGAAGKTPHFLVAKASHYNLTEGQWLACWATSPDTDTWHAFDHVTIGASDIEFYNDTPFPGGAVYIASYPMYPFSRTQRKVAEWAANAYVGETASTTNNVLGNATARDNADGSGRTVPSLPFYGLKITTSAENTKNKGILTAGNHPHETPGSYQLEGAIDFLLSGDTRARFLLDWFEFSVYPSINPQGRHGGHFRSGPQDVTKDHNRFWNTTGTLEDIDAFKAAFTADTGDVLGVALDYHSWMATDGAKSLAPDSTTALWVAFLAAMQAQDATFVKRTDDATAGMIATYWANLATPAALAGYIDHGHTATLGPTNWKQTGANTMIALANLLATGRFANGPAVGARSFVSGSGNRIDWASVFNSTGQPFTFSAWVKRTADIANAYLLCAHDAGDTSYGLVINLLNGKLDMIRHGTTDYLWFESASSVTLNTWHHILVTSNGGLTAGSVTMRVDGVAKTVNFTNGSGAETAHTGLLSLGGRYYSDTRNYTGLLAQVAWWNADYSSDSDMLAGLAAGYDPTMYHADHAVFIAPMNTSSLVVDPGGTGTADGTTHVSGVGNGPPIIY